MKMPRPQSWFLRLGSSQRGASAVEFAILLPLMLLILGGITDFGRAMFTEIQLQNAAREGARAAVVSDASEDEIIARASSSAPDMSDLEVTVDSQCPGDTAQVTATKDFDWILLGPAARILGSTTTFSDNLSATAVMQCGG